MPLLPTIYTLAIASIDFNYTLYTTNALAKQFSNHLSYYPLLAASQSLLVNYSG